MARITLSVFKDPERRPRAMVWTGVAVVALVAVTIAALGVTSTYWFCANGCHKVQDDTIIAYDSSAHSEVSCMACHMPVGAGPVTFLLHKVEALGEAYLTVTDTYELPLNEGSHLALSEHMPSEQCTQCHSTNREITPGPGIKIDHQIHAQNDVACTWCHNRVAHPENFELTLPGNEKHEDFMEMTACFRCHGQDPLAKAPGACDKCHPADFPLKPESHEVAGFYQQYGDSRGHAEMAKEEASRVARFEAEAHEAGELPPVESVNYCSTCHSLEEFCSGCHGLQMPHPAGFAEGHGDKGRESPEICANCHAKSADTAAGTEFCNACHHSAGDPSKPWIPQHFNVVRQQGAQACFECHNPTFCANCHVRGIRGQD
ncbi:MAG: hypothetical protein Kow0056_06650 [Coriobacteriia bacterium]